MPLNLKADAARQRHVYKHMNAEQRAHEAALQAHHRAKMTPEQNAHQSALHAQRRICQCKKGYYLSLVVNNLFCQTTAICSDLATPLPTLWCSKVGK
jgi:hypothetical protein